MAMKIKRVFVGMSGGVDSSVAAALLNKQGYEVIGVHLKCYNVDGCAAQDAEDARRVAETIGIPFYTFDFEKEYKEIKFGLFYEKAMELGADFVATGHYVLKIENSCLPVGMGKLKIARDRAKDQSYFLWTLRSEQLAHCLFPIGEYTKPQVRKLAARFGLHNAQKKDSQGICFLGQVSLPDFLKKYIKPKKGAILDIHGNEIGEHHGAHFYTIGQRHLGIKNQELGIKNKPNQKPFYVADKDVKKNVIVIAEGDKHPALYKKEVALTDINFLMPPVANYNGALMRQSTTSVLARVRYRQPLAKAKLKMKNEKISLEFNKPVKFVAAGQSVVFYNKKGVMLGGGVIKSAK